MLGVEKRTQSVLLESSSIEKIMEIDNHVCCAMSGLTADARTMVDHARVTAQVSWHFTMISMHWLYKRTKLTWLLQNHQFTFNEDIKVESVTQAVCDLALRFGESTEDDEPMMVRAVENAACVGAPRLTSLSLPESTFRCGPFDRRCGRDRTATVRSFSKLCSVMTSADEGPLPRCADTTPILQAPT